MSAKCQDLPKLGTRPARVAVNLYL